MPGAAMNGDGFKFLWEKHFRESGLPLSAHAVGLMLGTYADGDGRNARPGVARLVRDLGTTRETVTRALEALQKVNLVEREPRDPDAPRLPGEGTRGPRADVYRLTLPHDTGSPDCPHCKNRSAEPTSNQNRSAQPTGNNQSAEPTGKDRNQSAEPTSSQKKLVGSGPGNWSAQPTPPDQVFTRPVFKGHYRASAAVPARANASAIADTSPAASSDNQPAPAAADDQHRLEGGPMPHELTLPGLEPASGPSDADTLFARFWDCCQNKTDKKPARTAWDKAVKDGADPQTLIDAMAAYRGDVNPRPWLNRKYWLPEEDRPVRDDLNPRAGVITDAWARTQARGLVSENRRNSVHQLVRGVLAGGQFDDEATSAALLRLAGRGIAPTAAALGRELTGPPAANGQARGHQPYRTPQDQSVYDRGWTQ